jgi:hypothetical protein
MLESKCKAFFEIYFLHPAGPHRGKGLCCVLGLFDLAEQRDARSEGMLQKNSTPVHPLLFSSSFGIPLFVI